MTLLVVNLGLPKSGTTTLAKALRMSGLRVADHRMRGRNTDDPALKGARRANLEAASDYLDAAPLVVTVAPDAPLPDVPLTVPRELADPETLQQLVEAYDLGSPVGRLLKALELRPS